MSATTAGARFRRFVGQSVSGKTRAIGSYKDFGGNLYGQ